MITICLQYLSDIPWAGKQEQKYLLLKFYTKFYILFISFYYSFHRMLAIGDIVLLKRQKKKPCKIHVIYYNFNLEYLTYIQPKIDCWLNLGWIACISFQLSLVFWVSFTFTLLFQHSKKISQLIKNAV